MLPASSSALVAPLSVAAVSLVSGCAPPSVLLPRRCTASVTASSFPCCMPSATVAHSGRSWTGSGASAGGTTRPAPRQCRVACAGPTLCLRHVQRSASLLTVRPAAAAATPHYPKPCHPESAAAALHPALSLSPKQPAAAPRRRRAAHPPVLQEHGCWEAQRVGAGAAAHRAAQLSRGWAAQKRACSQRRQRAEGRHSGRGRAQGGLLIAPPVRRGASMPWAAPHSSATPFLAFSPPAARARSAPRGGQEAAGGGALRARRGGARAQAAPTPARREASAWHVCTRRLSAGDQPCALQLPGGPHDSRPCVAR